MKKKMKSLLLFLFAEFLNIQIWNARLEANDSRRIFNLLWLYLDSDTENDNQRLIKSKKAIDAQ